MHKLTLTFLVLFIAPQGAFGEAPNRRTPLADNAALQYWQAFSQLPTVEKEHEKLFEDPTGERLRDAAAAKLLESSRSSLMYLGRGGDVGQCDWGLDYSDGVSLLLPHLAKSRDLARLAALDARRAFERRDYQTGRNTINAIMTLGRHVRRDPIMISLLVGVSIESIAIDAAAPYIPDWKPAYADVASMLEKLPPATQFEKSLSTEKEFMARWIIKKLRDEDPRSPDAWREFWNTLFVGSDSPPPKVESAAAAIKLVEDLLPVYDQLERFMAMPQDAFEVQYPAFKQQTKAEHPLAGLLLPAIDQVRATQKRHEARLAILLAAVAVIESGPAKLADHKDPFGSGPFEYRVLDKGFELQSKLLHQGKPVALVIGQRK